MGDIIHDEDGGTVDISIRNDGKILYACNKCNQEWLAEATPAGELPKVDLKSLRDMVARLSQLRAQRGT